MFYATFHPKLLIYLDLNSLLGSFYVFHLIECIPYFHNFYFPLLLNPAKNQISIHLTDQKQIFNF